MKPLGCQEGIKPGLLSVRRLVTEIGVPGWNRGHIP